MGVVKEWFIWSQAVLSMLLVQVFATGMQLLSKVILNEGTFIFALMAYRHVVAAVCVAPFAFYFERCNALQKLRWSVWFWLFFNALAGITLAMGLYYYGLRDTSATYSTNFLNLIPISTFVASTIFRMEKLRLKTWADHHSDDHPHTTAEASKINWTRGTFFLVGSCLSYTAWYMLQVKLLKVFPSKYWATMLTCIIASVQATVVGLCLDRRKSAWMLGSKLELLTIVYSIINGVYLHREALATAATFCLISWAINIRGPTYPPMFNPLTLIFVAISETLILGEPIRVGTLLGMVLIIVGLYSFLWGKTEEIKRLAQKNVATTAGAEVSTGIVDAGVQSTVMPLPSTSPTNTGIDVSGNPDRNTGKP
ncbi:WAT1-related protein [Quillaja saponaria]|uniref:WAT1-related protein n=1 Tax=Quillaja saponaria TaxID=32244 RepID=A0AAD7LK71_QUISA|nr:WAT1-related protein [Quillaja saponaria]